LNCISMMLPSATPSFIANLRGAAGWTISLMTRATLHDVLQISSSSRCHSSYLQWSSDPAPSWRFPQLHCRSTRNATHSSQSLEPAGALAPILASSPSASACSSPSCPSFLGFGLPLLPQPSRPCPPSSRPNANLTTPRRAFAFCILIRWAWPFWSWAAAACSACYLRDAARWDYMHAVCTEMPRLAVEPIANHYLHVCLQEVLTERLEHCSWRWGMWASFPW
jgi:hypothetical protein